MAVGGSGLHIDPFDQAALTEVIRRPLLDKWEREPTLAERIAPKVPVQSREVKMSVREVHAFGKGQFRAPGATPPLFEPSATFREETLELVLIDEMHRIKDEDWLLLNSNDENLRLRAGVQLTERGDILAIRNRRATESLIWDAFDGEATVEYPNGSTLVIDYGIPTGNKPNASVDWSDTANSDPIADIKAWQLLAANEVGFYGLKIHLSSEAWELLINSQSLIDKLTGTDRPLYVPTQNDVLSLLRDGTEFIITDAGYRDEGEEANRGPDSITRYLPKDKVLVTTEYSIDGERIADTPDGQVIVQTGFNQVDIRQGEQAEVIVHPVSHTHFLRYASARIPRIHHPGAFVWADVGTVE